MQVHSVVLPCHRDPISLCSRALLGQYINQLTVIKFAGRLVNVNTFRKPTLGEARASESSVLSLSVVEGSEVVAPCHLYGIVHQPTLLLLSSTDPTGLQLQMPLKHPRRTSYAPNQLDWIRMHLHAVSQVL